MHLQTTATRGNSPPASSIHAVRQPVQNPSIPSMLGRAFTLRCPRGGSRRTFIRRWFSKHERCRSCGICWRREEGFELGALTVNTVITFAALTIAMAIGFVTTAPDIPAVKLVIWFSSLAVLLPLVLYPFSFLLWLVFDLAARPPDEREIADANAWLGSQNSPA